jgi:hypothetical protein
LCAVNIIALTIFACLRKVFIIKTIQMQIIVDAKRRIRYIVRVMRENQPTQASRDRDASPTRVGSLITQSATVAAGEFAGGRTNVLQRFSDREEIRAACNQFPFELGGVICATLEPGSTGATRRMT